MHGNKNTKQIYLGEWSQYLQARVRMPVEHNAEALLSNSIESCGFNPKAIYYLQYRFNHLYNKNL